MKNIIKSLDINDNSSVIAALKANDEQAFENVYRHYYRGLCAFCSQYVIQDESEEIVQDTMMWLWENRSSLIADLTLKTLLFTIVKNKALNRITHHEIKRKVHQEIADKHALEFENPDFYLGNELFRIYEKALEKLPKEIRESYELNRNKHLTHKEIAQRLNVSPQTVNYRIGLALKILRVELKDYLPLLILLYHYK